MIHIGIFERGNRAEEIKRQFKKKSPAHTFKPYAVGGHKRTKFKIVQSHVVEFIWVPLMSTTTPLTPIPVKWLLKYAEIEN